MSPVSELPKRPIRVQEIAALCRTNDDIIAMLSTWGHLTEDEPAVVGGILHTSDAVGRNIGFDPERESWKEISRFTEIGIMNPAPAFAGFDILETWIMERYAADELTNFEFDIVLGPPK